MSDTRSTIVGLKAQDCPGDQTKTVARCLVDDTCGCIYGDAIRHIEDLERCRAFYEAWMTARRALEGK